ARRRYGQFDGFQVAQLADEDYVRVFAQRAAQGSGKGFGVDAHFPVVDKAVFTFMDKLDGVLDSDDMIPAVLIGIINHGSQGGGFAGSGRAGHDDQALVEHGELLQYRRKRGVEFLKVLEGKHPAGNLAEHRPDAVFLVEEIGAKAGNSRNFITKINITVLLKAFDLIFGGNFVEHQLQV